ncbi:phospholipase A1 member A-like isoform X2 [Pectinophora gossypiella]|nr:phospholipase A1 member A-like isoform X2 [Pectinophora gossypiella]XP_049880120.1 phospholipase A1 member A-like isoform X2 [Pectinophora gossypiella]XP_049880121.1 phospholipase A1 member A-like isoform X2 [Pectinophora gossypiella]XP_049880122.1 phospholipase A1 member A-like isoform X2 [Pectinophora gossypiella]
MRVPVGSLAAPAAMLLLVLAGCAHAGRFTPPPDIGMPAGLIPDCPGVRKNASISAQSMPMLQVSFYRLDAGGNLLTRPMPVTAAHKMLASEKIDWSKKTVVHAVGWLDSAMFPHSRALAAAYARRGYNVFVTDTFAFLTSIYPKSVRLTRVIGKKLGEFLAKLTALGLRGERLELVGISLGAHIAGYTAAAYTALTGSRPRRLTGLDPAGPCFRALPPDMRFNAGLADQVDVIHTNIDGFGIAEPLGHVDVYVNGGEYQPGDVPYIPCLVICSHVRAVLYWWQAIEHPKKFIAVQCDSVQEARLANCYNNTVTNYIGLETRFDRPGIYYLSTSNEFPYYRGRAGLDASNEIYTSVVRSINDDNGFQV